MVIWPARLAASYITVEERKQILASVNDLVQTDHWSEALTKVIDDIQTELKGDPQEKTDWGTLALMSAIGIAVGLTLFIACQFFTPEHTLVPNSYLDLSFTSSK